MIGLRRRTVKLVDFDPEWTVLAGAACLALQNEAGDLFVETQHVGSTAIPGLPAKPVLDLAAAVLTFDVLPDLIPRLASMGYCYRGHRAETGGHLFIVESAPDVRTIHLHVVLGGSKQWRGYLAFRDALRRRVDLRLRYAELKIALAALHSDDTASYTAGKAAFIQEVLIGGIGD
ncbi:GrpB family protein [Paludibaculum fermentans]|uniref:GrpB family protein n=1 Tax=Paludibaculum fermentans TaxID=1473598 RepID=UPI003EB845AE